MRRMKHTQQAWWLNLSAEIIGFEGEGDGGAGDGGAGDEGAGDGSAGEGEGAAAGEGGASSGAEDTAGLKSALAKERAERKDLDKRLKAFEKAEATRKAADLSEVDRLKAENQSTAEKATRLAKGFKDSAIRTAIIEAAGKAKFRDATDALSADVIAAIGVEQDEDDPTQVTIDAATVTAAIKDLAKRKPHYLASAGDGGQGGQQRNNSGSKFGGSNNNGKVDPSVAALAEKYPALRGRISN